MHVFVDERTRSFEEFLLHHIAGCALIFSYVLANAIPVGTVAAWLHDIADVLASATKTFNGTIYKRTTLVCFVGCMVLWFITRLIWLPILIYNVFIVKVEVFQLFPIWNGIFLMVMQLLHIYWFIMFVKILIRAVRHDDHTDTQDAIEENTNKKID